MPKGIDPRTSPVLVFVYFGNSIPKYVYRNLVRTRLLFPRREIIFVTDNYKAINKLKKNEIKIIIKKNEFLNQNKLSEKLKHNWNFRDGFWNATLSRIFAVCEIQQEIDKSVLHVEADVILSANFPFEKFNEIHENTSYSLMSKSVGVASLLYLRNQKAANQLKKFIVDRSQIDSSLTDMTALGEYKLHNPKKIYTLPYISMEKDAYHKEMLRNALFMGGFFDPAFYGQYFFGIDERNNSGWRILFSRTLNDAISKNDSKLYLIERSLFLQNTTGSGSLFSLHVHSKDIRVFGMFALGFLLKIRNFQSKQGERRVITKHFYYRIILKVKHYLKRILYVYRG
jgi:hypothetical protein